MANKNFIDGQTIIEATDANSWEALKDKYTTLQGEINKKLTAPTNQSNAGNVLLAKADNGVEWSNLPKANKIDEITLANITNAGDAYSKEELQKMVELVNKNKETLNSVIQALKTADLMANS